MFPQAPWVTDPWESQPLPLPLNEAVLVGPSGTARPVRCVDLHMASPGMRTRSRVWDPAQVQETHGHALQAVLPQLLWK